MIEIIFAILAAISDGTKDFFNRVVMIKEDPYVYGFIQNVIATLLFIPLFLSVKFPTNNIVYLFILLSALAWVGIAIIGNYSYKYTEVSLRAPISQIRIIILLILSMLFLSEKLTLNKGIGTLLIFIGLFVLRFKGGKFDIKNKGIQLTVLTACLVALAAIFNKIALHYTVPEFQGFLIYLIPTVILFFFLKGKKKKFRSLFKNQWKIVLFGSFLGAAFTYLSLKAYALADVSTIFPIIKTSALITVLLGIIFLKEKQILRKIIATTIVLIGIIFIYSI
ncbi:EamA family transporter [Candidatus Woesearchaeota archaeon]|nr:EamA family transporter [Candidatus Woesearchaeota archaeon]